MITIERLGHSGDGIAPGPVYVPRTLPGEIIAGDIVDGRIDQPKILSPSGDRVKPRCPAYNRCGGCALHHAAPEFVVGWKASIVVQALAAHGFEAPLRNTHVSPPNSRRRAKLSGRRTKKGALVGFFGPRSDVLQSIDGCLTLTQGILDLIPSLEAFTVQFGSRKGVLQFWVLETETGMDVAVDGLQDSQDRFTDIVVWAQTAGLARLTIGDETLVTFTAPRLTFGTVAITPPPKGFTQATRDAETFLQSAVAEATLGAGHIIDLFAGAGTLSLPLARGASIHAVEGDADLLAGLDYGVRHAQGLKLVTHAKRDLFKRPLEADELKKVDAVILDPPRAGALAQVAVVARSGPPAVAMVSCNPITFARDAATLVSAGYRLDWIDVVDQFRWSTHIEVAAKFSR